MSNLTFFDNLFWSSIVMFGVFNKHEPVAMGV